MKIAVSHTTRLDYTDSVIEAVMDAHLGPRDDADQHVDQFELGLEPSGHVRRYMDGAGNIAHLLTCNRPHTYLEVTAETEVETWLDDPFQRPARPPRPLGPVELADYLDPSPLVPRFDVVDEMAKPFRPSDPHETFDAVRGMAEMIYRTFAYRQNVTDVGTTVDQIVDRRQGVCQDFTHLLIGLCRSVGIPARYVSGYIVLGDGGDQSPSRGAGASHAWVEAFTPSHGWRGFDPTNNLVANAHYVKVAIGRDYRDVPPTRGTFHGTAQEQLSVSVDTRVLEKTVP